MLNDSKQIQRNDGVLLLCVRLFLAVFLLIAFDTFMLTSHGRFVLSDFFSQIELNNDGSYSNEGNSGYYIFGPYAAYPKGQYILEFYGVSEDSNSTFDVCSKERLFLSGKYVGTSRYSVELDEDVDSLEFRIFYEGKGLIRLDSLYFCPKDDAGFISFIVFSNVLFIVLVYLWLGRRCGALLDVLSILLLILLNAFFMEYAMRGSIYDTLFFLRSAGFSFFVECLPFILLSLGLWLLWRNFSVAVIPALILQCILALVDINFERLRGNPFQLSDIFLAREAAAVSDHFQFVFPTNVLYVVCGFFLILLIIGKRGKWTIQRTWFRLASAAFCLMLAVFSGAKIDIVLDTVGLDPTIYVLDVFYDNFGYYTGMLRTRPQRVKRPDGYSQAVIEDIIKDIVLEEPVTKLPNIIYIQVETLYDMSLLMEPVWNADPLEPLKKLQEEYTSGYVLSPTAGGGTCNVEFEALTGYPYSNLGGTPFNNRIEEGTISIVSILNDAGYSTASMHFNTGNFFNRKNVYPHLGFERSIFIEDVEHKDEDKINDWITDRYTFDMLIRDYEARDKSRPYFAHVVTTQNHSAYLEHYDAQNIFVSEAWGDEETREQLQNYLNEEKESCLQLLRLVSYFETVEEPTILVIWGDHCPGLGLFNMELSEDSLEYLTPFLVFNNYNLESEKLGIVAAYNISPYILCIAGLHTDAYMTWSMDKHLPAVKEHHSISISGESNPLTEQETKIMNDAYLLQYDRMFGEAYSEIKRVK